MTNSNREQFVALYVNHLLVKSVERQFQAFSRGFHKVSVTIQIQAVEQYFYMVLFIMLYKVILILSLWIKP